MQTDWSILQPQVIDWLRFPMAVAVVMIHHGADLITSASEPLRSICILFEEGICRLAVPFFFFTSGYLFYNKLQDWDWSIWKTKIMRRVHTLLIPYILWNIIAFLAFWAFTNMHGSSIGFYSYFLDSGGFKMFWGVKGNLPISVRDVPIDKPLWFVRDLVYFILASPLLYFLIRRTRICGLLVLALTFLFVPGIIPEGFVFFFIGAWLQINNKNVVEMLHPQRKLLYLISVCFLAATYAFHGVEYWGRFSKAFFMLAGVGASFCGAAQLIERDRVHVRPFLSHSSFFIYTSFEILILHSIASPLVNTFLPTGGEFWSCLEFFLTPAVTVGLCLALLFIMEHVIPCTTSILTGNRKIKPIYS